MKFSNLIRLHWAAAACAAGAHRDHRHRLPARGVGDRPASRPARQGGGLDRDGRRKAGGQLRSSGSRSPTPTATRYRSTSRAVRRPLETATTRWPPARRNLGPESIVDTPGDPSLPKDSNGYKASLLTLVCSRSTAIGDLEGVAGARPFCTGDGVGAVLSVIGPRDSRGNVVHPTRVISVNEPCSTAERPFLDAYEGVRVECAKFGEDYSIGQIVPIRGAAPAAAGGAGRRRHRQRQRAGPGHLDRPTPTCRSHRVAKARGVSADQIRAGRRRQHQRSRPRLPR